MIVPAHFGSIDGPCSDRRLLGNPTIEIRVDGRLIPKVYAFDQAAGWVKSYYVGPDGRMHLDARSGDVIRLHHRGKVEASFDRRAVGVRVDEIEISFMKLREAANRAISSFVEALPAFASLQRLRSQ